MLVPTNRVMYIRTRNNSSSPLLAHVPRLMSRTDSGHSTSTNISTSLDNSPPPPRFVQSTSTQPNDNSRSSDSTILIPSSPTLLVPRNDNNPHAPDPSLRPWQALWEPKAANIKYYPDVGEDTCRAYRKFPADRFLWLRLPQEILKLRSKIKRILKTPLIRTDSNGVEHIYEFLCSTDSKLKDNPKVGFFESLPGCTADDVLNSFGDLQSVLEKSGAGKYIARLGLSFSSTHDAGELQADRIANLTDVKNADGTKVFTDGCGVISEEYAKKVAEKLKIDYVPSG